MASSPACLAQEGAFGVARRLGTTINTPAFEWGPSLTEDGSLIVFGRKSPGPILGDIWLGERDAEDPESEFRVRRIENELINTELDETDPFISPDGLKLYFERGDGFNAPAGLTHARIWVAERTSRHDPFGDPEVLKLLPAEFDLQWAPTVTRDDRTLVFVARPFVDVRSQQRLYEATRPAPGAPFGTPRAIEELPVSPVTRPRSLRTA